MHIQGYQHIIESKSLVKVEGEVIFGVRASNQSTWPSFGVDDDTVVHPVHTYKQLTNYHKWTESSEHGYNKFVCASTFYSRFNFRYHFVPQPHIVLCTPYFI